MRLRAGAVRPAMRTVQPAGRSPGRQSSRTPRAHPVETPSWRNWEAESLAPQGRLILPSRISKNSMATSSIRLPGWLMSEGRGLESTGLDVASGDGTAFGHELLDTQLHAITLDELPPNVLRLRRRAKPLVRLEAPVGALR